jgi:hypothetical protein
VAEARAGDDVARGIVEGHDLYGVTAAACGEAVQRLAGGAPGGRAGAGRPVGALSPAEAFDPEEFLGALSGFLSWRVQRR